ncbi:MAG: amidohydrolase family protein [Pseudomonadota bacterium]
MTVARYPLPLALFGLSLVGCSEDPSVLLIRGGEYLDVESGSLLPLETLVVRDGVIESLSAAEEAPLSGREIDATGRVVVPGLWDMHVHLGGADEADTYYLPAYMWDIYRGSPSKRNDLLANGVTVVRDVGGSLAALLRDRTESGELTGPRILAAGYLLTAKDGHPVATVYASSSLAASSNAIEVGTPNEARTAVERNVSELDADFIKLVYTSGLVKESELEGSDRETLPDWALASVPILTEDTLAAAIAEAHARGLRTAVHVDRVDEALVAVRAGADSIEHAVAASAMGPDQDQIFVEEMVSGSVCWIPTLVVFDDLAPALLPSRASLVRRASDAGVKLAAGTDSGLGPSLHFGSSLTRELQLLHDQVGLSPAQAIRAATVDAAACAGRSASHGKISPGYVADLLVLDSSPLDDLTALESGHIEMVIANGKVVRER